MSLPLYTAPPVVHILRPTLLVCPILLSALFPVILHPSRVLQVTTASLGPGAAKSPMTTSLACGVPALNNSGAISAVSTILYHSRQ